MEPELVPVLIVATVFGASIVITAIIALAIHRGEQLRHETIRAALERGHPVPEQLLPGHRSGPARNDLQKGVILLCLGAAISLLLWTKGNPNWASGLVIAALGLGLLASHALRHRDDQPGAPAGDRAR